MTEDAILSLVVLYPASHSFVKNLTGTPKTSRSGRIWLGKGRAVVGVTNHDSESTKYIDECLGVRNGHTYVLMI